jgi:hypothetical protein
VRQLAPFRSGATRAPGQRLSVDVELIGVLKLVEVRLIPRVTRETIDGAAHVPQLTTPERYVEITTHALRPTVL